MQVKRSIRIKKTENASHFFCAFWELKYFSLYSFSMETLDSTIELVSPESSKSSSTGASENPKRPIPYK